jgi:hypothetical protein
MIMPCGIDKEFGHAPCNGRVTIKRKHNFSTKEVDGELVIVKRIGFDLKRKKPL